jgi:hypothetical protein
MSKLTNMQIRATIERLEAGIRQGEADARASSSAMRQRRRKLADYQAELGICRNEGRYRCEERIRI